MGRRMTTWSPSRTSSPHSAPTSGYIRSYSYLLVTCFAALGWDLGDQSVLREVLLRKGTPIDGLFRFPCCFPLREESSVRCDKKFSFAGKLPTVCVSRRKFSKTQKGVRNVGHALRPRGG